MANDIKKETSNALFQLNGVPEFRKAFPLALQHVVAMIVGCVTPAIIVSNSAGISEKEKVILIQASLVIAGISTLLQLFPIGKYFGSGLPVILGVSFAYVPSMQAIVESYDIGTILGAQIVGGIIAMVVGLFVKQLRKFFPPLITGTVVFSIGLSLYQVAINYMAGGLGSPTYGSLKNWSVAIFTLAIVTILNHFSKGLLKLASILIGMAAGYVLAFSLGMVNFSNVTSSNLVYIPTPLHFGINFNLSACVAIGLLFAINAIQAIGDFSATTIGSIDREPTDTELQGGIVAYGISNMLGAILGGLPTATYSQNVGIVVTTKVVNRIVLGLAAILILLAGIIPPFSALLTTIPSCVLGGATISVFASIAMTGIKLITSEPMTFRNTSIVGLAVAIGMGVTQAQITGALAPLPDWVTMIFGKSPVVLATLVAIFLNQVLPKEQKN